MLYQVCYQDAEASALLVACPIHLSKTSEVFDPLSLSANIKHITPNRSPYGFYSEISTQGFHCKTAALHDTELLIGKKKKFQQGSYSVHLVKTNAVQYKTVRLDLF